MLTFAKSLARIFAKVFVISGYLRKQFSRKCENETFHYYPRFNSNRKNLYWEKFVFHISLFCSNIKKYISFVALLFINIASAFEELITVLKSVQLFRRRNTPRVHCALHGKLAQRHDDSKFKREVVFKLRNEKN